MARMQVIVGVFIALALILVGLWAMASRPSETIESSALQPLVYITDAAEVRANVELSRLAILTSENFVGHKIRVIEGFVTNKSSDLTIHSIRLKLTFTDFTGVPIQESEEEALASGNSLAPGDRLRFSARFENLPNKWNFRVPIGEIVRFGY